MTEYTPGPWKWNGDVLLQDRSYPQLYVGRMDTGPVDAHYREGNRNLISAAPELLEAVKTMASYYNDEVQLNGTAIKMMLEHAIAKAEAPHA